MIDKKYLAKNWFTIIGLTFFFCAVVYSKYTDGLLAKRAKYTIGYTYKSRWSLRSGKFVHYYINVGKEQCKGSGDADKYADIIEKGGKYLVAFDSLNCKESRIFYELPIPDSINNCPVTGWLLPPCDYDQSNVFKYFKTKKWYTWEIK